MLTDKTLDLLTKLRERAEYEVTEHVNNRGGMIDMTVKRLDAITDMMELLILANRMESAGRTASEVDEMLSKLQNVVAMHGCDDDTAH